MKTKFYHLKLDPKATYRIIMQPAGYGKARAELEMRMRDVMKYLLRSEANAIDIAQILIDIGVALRDYSLFYGRDPK